MCIAVVVTLRLRVAKVNEGGLEGHYKPQETTGARAVGPLRRCGRHGKNSRMMTGDTATVGGEIPSTPVRQPAAGLQKRTDSRSVASHPNSAANFTIEISRPSEPPETQRLICTIEISFLQESQEEGQESEKERGEM